MGIFSCFCSVKRICMDINFLIELLEPYAGHKFKLQLYDPIDEVD